MSTRSERRKKKLKRMRKKKLRAERNACTQVVQALLWLGPDDGLSPKASYASSRWAKATR